jgi:hypothetical protein
MPERNTEMAHPKKIALKSEADTSHDTPEARMRFGLDRLLQIAAEGRDQIVQDAEPKVKCAYTEPGVYMLDKYGRCGVQAFRKPDDGVIYAVHLLDELCGPLIIEPVNPSTAMLPSYTVMMDPPQLDCLLLSREA